MFSKNKQIDKALLYQVIKLAEDFDSIETKNSSIRFSNKKEIGTENRYKMDLYDKNSLSRLVINLNKDGTLHSFSLRQGTKEIPVTINKVNKILSSHITSEYLSNKNVIDVSFSERYLNEQESLVEQDSLKDINIDKNLNPEYQKIINESYDNSKHYLLEIPKIEKKEFHYDFKETHYHNEIKIKNSP